MKKIKMVAVGLVAMAVAACAGALTPAQIAEEQQVAADVCAALFFAESIIPAGTQISVVEADMSAMCPEIKNVVQEVIGFFNGVSDAGVTTASLTVPGIPAAGSVYVPSPRVAKARAQRGR